MMATKRKIDPIKRNIIIFVFIMVIICSLILFMVRSEFNRPIPQPDYEKKFTKDNNEKIVNKTDEKAVGNSDIILLSDRGNPKVLSESSESNDFHIAGDISKRRIYFQGFKINGSSLKQSSIIVSEPYPYCQTEFPNREAINPFNMRNLIKGKDQYSYYFMNVANKKNQWCFMKITIDRKTKAIKVEDRRILNDIWNYDYFTDIDSSGKLIIANNGLIIDINTGKEIEFNSDMNFYYDSKRVALENIAESLLVKGAIFLNDGSLFLQGEGNRTRHGIKNDCENLLIINRMRKDTNIDSTTNDNLDNQSKIIKSGIFEPGPIYRNEWISPIGLSKDGDKVAFQALYPDEKNASQSLWLSIYSIGSGNIENVVEIRTDEKNYIQLNERFIRWCPLSQSDLIAVYTCGKLQIINVKEKRIVKVIENNSIRSLRWSNDGNRIGLLTTKGELYIYEIQKALLKKIIEDKDLFDFFWI